MKCDSIIISEHGLVRLFERTIQVEDVRRVIEKGEVITDYPNDKPYPSCLLLGFVNDRPLHVVVAKDKLDGKCIVVTAYEPNLLVWEPNFKLKRRK
jgi:Domain of unknown function (DUF4258)